MSSALQELLMLKGNLCEKIKLLEQQYDSAKRDYEAAERIIEILQRQEPVGTPTPLQPYQAIGVSPLNMDFNGTGNLAERLVRIAEYRNGEVNITKAAEILIEAGQTISSKKNIRSMIHRTLNEDTDTWEKVEPGTFQIRERQISEEENIPVQSEIGILRNGV